ncbi:MAG: hypothetical protein HRT88_00175 [Lentisphaeraceae bacterium]|nr:hypothetical protein [Lentisphaeraceae bacterium]
MKIALICFLLILSQACTSNSAQGNKKDSFSKSQFSEITPRIRRQLEKNGYKENMPNGKFMIMKVPGKGEKLVLLSQDEQLLSNAKSDLSHKHSFKIIRK